MNDLEPYVREAGTGPAVVCTHSNASSSAQWRGLIDLLAPQFHVLAPDLYDSGKSPSWPSDRVIGLRDEVALIEPVLARADDSRGPARRWRWSDIRTAPRSP
jgi:pimeloyl-ACP methyl ester carboxylesterase